MTKETRYNLIFLAIILAIMVPAAVILFRKKLEPTVRPMYLPDPVPHAIAYMVPGPPPPGMSRIAPPHTSAWVQSLVKEHAGDDATIAHSDDAQPLVSDSGALQLLALDRAEPPTRAWVLHWRDADTAAAGTWSLRDAADRTIPVTIADTTLIEIPRLVREELGEYGLLRPPRHVAVQQLTFPAAASPDARLHFVSSTTQATTTDSVPLFTNPTRTTK